MSTPDPQALGRATAEPVGWMLLMAALLTVSIAIALYCCIPFLRLAAQEPGWRSVTRALVWVIAVGLLPAVLLVRAAWDRPGVAAESRVRQVNREQDVWRSLVLWGALWIAWTLGTLFVHFRRLIP